MQQIESVTMLNVQTKADYLQNDYHVPNFSKTGDASVFRKCTPNDLSQILTIRENFPMGNGGSLKYCKPDKVPFYELYGLFYQGFLIGISRISVLDFYYYRQKARFLYLDCIPQVAYMSSIYIYPVFRKRFGMWFLCRFYKLIETFGLPIVSELRGMYDEAKQKSLFWCQYLDSFLGDMKYKFYLEYTAKHGEIAIINKLPKILAIQQDSCVGQFHEGSRAVRCFNKKNHYIPIGTSYSSGALTYFKGYQ